MCAMAAGWVTLQIFKCLKPVIAAVNGPAVGIGVTMQLAMDIRIASEARFGLCFPSAASCRKRRRAGFPRIVGIAQALDWCFYGPRISGAGSAGRPPGVKVVPPDELLPTARALAKDCPQKPHRCRWR
jgi:enoyl-CoA hydratase/carnithine racemase